MSSSATAAPKTSASHAAPADSKDFSFEPHYEVEDAQGSVSGLRVENGVLERELPIAEADFEDKLSAITDGRMKASRPFQPELSFVQQLRRDLHLDGVDANTAQAIYENMVIQYEREEWHSACGLPRDFHNVLGIATVHMWIVKMRLQTDGVEGKRLLEYVFDAFWRDWDDRLFKWGVPGIVLNSKLKKLQTRVFGLCTAFDHAWALRQAGMGDDAFLGVLWRNLYDCDDAADRSQLELLFEYMKRELVYTNEQPQEQLFAGELFWNEPPDTPPAAPKDLGSVRQHRDPIQTGEEKPKPA